MSALCSRCGGTPGYRVKLSVQAGQLLAPAELGLARTVAVSQRGHSKEDGADASPVHFSPSLSRAASATPASLWEAASVQVALLVAVQPGSYKVEGECEEGNRGEEGGAAWVSKERGNTALAALLVRVLQ